METAGSGDTMILAREGGVYLPAVLSIQWRYRAEDGSPYPVPFLQIGMSMQQLAEGQLPAGPGGLLAQLQGVTSGEEMRALAGSQARAIEAPPADGEPGLGLSGQYFADLVPMAKDRLDIEAIAADAREAGVSGQMIRADDEVPEQLREYLTRKWRDFPPTPAGQNREAS